MTLLTLMVFEIVVALALGFVIGRMWQMRRDMLEGRTSFAAPPIARVPRP
jgi:hypothetical protein